jgi:hypothetical protein
MPATHIWLDGAPCARSDAFLISRRADHFHAQLMTENPWIREKRLSAREGVQVGSTDADAMHAD